MRSNAWLIIADQSSGSIDSRYVVEPTTSANRAVTGLRSPVILAARIFATRGAGAVAARRVRRSTSDSSRGAIGLPQLMQKRASAGTDAAQVGHVMGGAPVAIS